MEMYKMIRLTGLHNIAEITKSTHNLQRAMKNRTMSASSFFFLFYLVDFLQ